MWCAWAISAHPTVIAAQDDVRGGREAAVYELIFSDEANEDVRLEDMQQLRAFVPQYCKLTGASAEGCDTRLIPCVTCVERRARSLANCHTHERASLRASMNTVPAEFAFNFGAAALQSEQL